MGLTTVIQFLADAKNFPLSRPVQLDSAARTASYLDHEDDHLPPSSAEVKNAWS